ncbi:MAG: DUF721 domain-containing protein [Acidobacteria bacterium]|nr:DUF721 domain-containing protein [Acidobacteriota bacterium]
MEGIAKLLPPAVRQHLFRSDSSLLELLNSLWASMVGRGIAKQCRPVEFSSGTLTIVTSCPNWAVQFRQLGEEIRQNINKFLGAEFVKKIRVRLDPTFDAKAQPAEKNTIHPPGRFKVKMPGRAPEESRDVHGILRRSYEKYFSRNNRKAD